MKKEGFAAMKILKRPLRLLLFIVGVWLLFLFTFSTIYPVADLVREAAHKQIAAHKSVYLSDQQIPRTFRLAMIETEDRRFYDHFGVDPIGIFRSIVIDLRGDQFSEGGSTITQQLVRNTILTPEKTLTRKIKEAVLAVALERFMNKQEIFDLYANVIYFGHGAYGAEQAAQVYFGKSLTSLSLPQWAMLAGLPNAPSELDPFQHMNQAKIRQKEVLSNLVETHFITEKEAEEAYQKKILLK
jgi:monofunctional glycosyltransferase